MARTSTGGTNDALTPTGCLLHTPYAVTSFWLVQLLAWPVGRALGWPSLVWEPHQARRLQQVALVVVQVLVRRPV